MYRDVPIMVLFAALVAAGGCATDRFQYAAGDRETNRAIAIERQRGTNNRQAAVPAKSGMQLRADSLQ